MRFPESLSFFLFTFWKLKLLFVHSDGFCNISTVLPQVFLKTLDLCVNFFWFLLSVLHCSLYFLTWIGDGLGCETISEFSFYGSRTKTCFLLFWWKKERGLFYLYFFIVLYKFEDKCFFLMFLFLMWLHIQQWTFPMRFISSSVSC